MKSALLPCLVLAFASHLSARTFTDSQGRKLEAEVVAVQQGQVRIRRADGQEFTLPVTTFSAADQAFLQQWKPAAAPAGAAAKPDPAATKDAKAEERKANRALEDSVFPKWRDGVAFGWKAKPTLKLASNDAELGKHVEAVFEQVCQAAGLQAGGANLVLEVHLGPLDEIKKLRAAETTPAAERGAIAYYAEVDAEHALTRAAIYQSTDRYDKDHRPHARADLITYLLQSFGLADYTRGLDKTESSLAFDMSADPGPESLTELDKKLLAFLYKHLPPGTEKADFGRIFRKSWAP
jgi:hypothetical protein